MPATDPAAIQSMCAAMAGNDPDFKKLRIEDATFDCEGWDGICQALSSSTAVTLVSLHRVILPSTGLADLAKTIVARPTRVNLELFRVPVDMTRAEELANILKGSPRIESVSLFEVGLGDDGAAVLAKMVEETEDLSQFCLMDASVGEPGQNDIARALGPRSSVKFSGVDAFECHTASLAVNKSLERLTLHKRFMGPLDGLNCLTSSLRKNTTLKELRYRSFAGKSDDPVVAHAATSSISLIDDFLFAVAASLKENRTLRSVDVMPHSTADGLRALALAARDYPRVGGLMFAAVDSVPEGHENKTLLHQCADELGLPPGKVNGEVVWDDQKAFEMLHAKHLAKAQAFSMGMHSRLGAKSQVLQLVAATDCFGVIMREFWGTSYLG